MNTQDRYISEYNVVIKPPKKFSFGWTELWQYRELLYFFSLKEIKIRYKQAVLGVLWTWLQPLILMTIFVFVLHKGIGLSTDNIPSPLYYLSGLLIWNLFSQGVNQAAQSMLSHGNIIKKIYFPRLVIPISAILTASFDYVINLIIFIILLVYFQVSDGMSVNWSMLLFALFIAYFITIVTSFSIGTFLAAVNVKYRDVRYILPFITQGLFFVTPIMYDGNSLKLAWLERTLAFNPLNYAIQTVRTSLGNGSWSNLELIPFGMVGILIIIFFVAIYTFRKMEAYFADIV